MHAKYEVSASNGSKVIANVKVDNRQTDRQTNRQDKNNMPAIIRSGGIKKSDLIHDVNPIPTEQPLTMTKYTGATRNSITRQMLRTDLLNFLLKTRVVVVKPIRLCSILTRHSTEFNMPI